MYCDSHSPITIHIHTTHNNDMILTWSIRKTLIISDFTHQKNINMKHSKMIYGSGRFILTSYV